MKETLQMKRVLRTALLVLLLGAFEIGNVFADGYDFAEVCPSGQMLYYKIDLDDANAVMVVAPYHHYMPQEAAPYVEPWGEGYEKPVGDVIIPESISNGLIVKSIWTFYANSYPYTNYPISIGAFQDCTEITSVIIPNTVTHIDYCAFAGCTSLSSVTIGNSVTTIGIDEPTHSQYGAFSDCTSLTSIEFSNSLSYIGYGTFKGCTSLSSITLPNSLTTIKHGAFADCSNLSNISLPSSLKEIAHSAFRATKWYEEQNDGVLYLGIGCMGYKGEKPVGNLVIAEGTKIIAEDAFSECEDLSSVSFPNSLTAIGEWAFNYCEGLTSVMIPKSVTHIGVSAFKKCSRLTIVYYNAENAECSEAFTQCSSLATITIGPDVSNIDSNAFKDCNTVHLVVALGATPAVLGPDAFSDLAENSMLMVPCGKKMTYFSQWNMFPYDNILENCDQYTVSMSGVGAGGSITPSTTNAQMGEEVRLTVTPNAGMVLKSIEICNANDPTLTIPYYFVGKANTKIGFIMPQFGVTVHAVFKTSGASVGENNIVVSVYPNPTNGQVTIEAEALKHITISNTLGQIIYEGQADGNMFEYDFSKYGTGLYLIRIETASGTLVKRVFVER